MKIIVLGAGVVGVTGAWYRAAAGHEVADFFEQEVDDAVEALASLMEPAIMVILGGMIGGLVVAMYLPIFKLGGAV